MCIRDSSFKYRVGPTLARHDLWAPSININSLEIFDFPYTWCFMVTTIHSLSRSGIPLAFTETNWYCILNALSACSKELTSDILPRFNLVIYDYGLFFQNTHSD